MCGFVGRARLNINLSVFEKADTETRRRIVREIMDQFNVPEQWRMQVEHAALKKARDAWRNWKHMLYKKYLSEGKDPIPAYPQITKADWAEFKRVRATTEFTQKSAKQSELHKRNTHPLYGYSWILRHETDMGPGGQRSSSGGWESGL